MPQVVGWEKALMVKDNGTCIIWACLQDAPGMLTTEKKPACSNCSFSKSKTIGQKPNRNSQVRSLELMLDNRAAIKRTHRVVRYVNETPPVFELFIFCVSGGPFEDVLSGWFLSKRLCQHQSKIAKWLFSSTFYDGLCPLKQSCKKNK